MYTSLSNIETIILNDLNDLINLKKTGAIFNMILETLIMPIITIFIQFIYITYT